MENRFVCFSGHRDSWQNVGIEEKLVKVVERLIQNGYKNFYDGGMGEFDRISASVVFALKKKYPDVRIIRVETYYHEDREKGEFNRYDEYFTLELGNIYFKQKIILKNRWLVDHADILVCNVFQTYKSGAYLTLKYAKRREIPIINLATME
jgi:uncharacterized phage-like protein YoqJ